MNKLTISELLQIQDYSVFNNSQLLDIVIIFSNELKTLHTVKNREQNDNIQTIQGLKLRIAEVEKINIKLKEVNDIVLKKMQNKLSWKERLTGKWDFHK